MSTVGGTYLLDGSTYSARGTTRMWKRLISSEDLIAHEAVIDDLHVRIEARSTPDGWNIIKRYYMPQDNEHSFTEDYFRPSLSEAREVIKRIQQDVLTKHQIRKIKEFRKYIELSLMRQYHDSSFEKWSFTVHSIKKPIAQHYPEDGTVIVRHGRSIEVDIMVKEKFRHFEEEIINLIDEKLGFINRQDHQLLHNLYYYSDSSSYTTSPQREQLVSMLVR